LPTPRVRPAGDVASGDAKKRPPASEIAEALLRHRRIIVHVPRTYPDPALSWIVGSSLLLSESGGRTIIPVVIEGRDIGPPNDTPFMASKVPLISNIASHGGEYVYIIDSPPLTSKTKREFLAKAIKDGGDDQRFILIVRDDKSFVQEVDI